MRERPYSLRSALTTILVVIASVAVGLSIALVVFTTYLHRASAALADAVESVRSAEEAQLSLLLHARVGDSVVRRTIEDDLLRNLREATEHSRGDGVRERAVELRVRAFVDAARGPQPIKLDALHNDAFAALTELVTANASQARAAKERAAAWEKRGDTVGLLGAVVVVTAAAAVAWWLNGRAFRPLLELAETMDRFGHGDRRVRARESGPSEVRMMATRFNEMARALDAEREAQMTFLGGVAHDLRNPISALVLAVHTIPTEGPGAPEGRVARTVALIRRQLARLDRMVGDFLDTAQIESGKLELRFEVRDARELVREACALYAEASAAHPIQVELPEWTVSVRCDPVRFEQVVSNLVSNAIKYSPAGGPVRIELSVEEGNAKLTVRDHGIGVSEPISSECSNRSGARASPKNRSRAWASGSSSCGASSKHTLGRSRSRALRAKGVRSA